jgi:hypothetical protein
VADWPEVYAELVEANPDWGGVELAYLDEDDIPELIVSIEPYSTSTANRIGIYQYQNGEAVQLVEEFDMCRMFWYIPKGNLMYVWWGHGSALGENLYTIGTIQNGSYVVLDQIDHQYVQSLDVDKNDYYHWESVITEEEYHTLMAEYRISYTYDEPDDYIWAEFADVDQNTSNQLRYDPYSFLDLAN